MKLTIVASTAEVRREVWVKRPSYVDGSMSPADDSELNSSMSKGLGRLEQDLENVCPRADCNVSAQIYDPENSVYIGSVACTASTPDATLQGCELTCMSQEQFVRYIEQEEDTSSLERGIATISLGEAVDWRGSTTTVLNILLFENELPFEIEG